MAEDFDDHRRMFDRGDDLQSAAQFGQCSMSMSIFPELTQYWNRFQIGTAN
jgi:hypothetical protein